MKHFGLSVVLIFTLGLLGGIVWYLTQEGSSLFRPIKEYKVLSSNTHIKPAEIDQIMQRYLGRSFWEIELEEIQSELIQLDWANDAQVKRSWPDQLYVSIEEQKPIARWFVRGLVNQMGVVFYPNNLDNFEHLVMLEGQLSDIKQILITLTDYQTELKKIGFTISALKQQLDGVWNISIQNGSKIILDSIANGPKLNRFMRAFPKLSKAQKKSPQVYDLRYSNGFTIGSIASLNPTKTSLASEQ